MGDAFELVVLFEEGALVVVFPLPPVKEPSVEVPVEEEPPPPRFIDPVPVGSLVLNPDVVSLDFDTTFPREGRGEPTVGGVELFPWVPPEARLFDSGLEGGMVLFVGV